MIFIQPAIDPVIFSFSFIEIRWYSLAYVFSFLIGAHLIKILNPIINSDSVWNSHALYLLAEYFFDKNQKQKAKEFYSQILDYKKSNENILTETRKRLSRDFSE